MKHYVIFFLIFGSRFCSAQTNDESSIRNLLAQQTESWNQGDIESFMKTYWHSDSLMFIGKNGITYGWKNTLENYKKSYPNAAAMGKLSFDILSVKQLSPVYFNVVGKWHLKRSIGDLTGHFTLILKMINNQWLIISDHSS